MMPLRQEAISNDWFLLQPWLWTTGYGALALLDAVIGGTREKDGEEWNEQMTRSDLF